MDTGDEVPLGDGDEVPLKSPNNSELNTQPRIITNNYNETDDHHPFSAISPRGRHNIHQPNTPKNLSEIDRRLLADPRSLGMQIRSGALRKCAPNSFPTGLELNAMSVASLYNGEDDDEQHMETDKDFNHNHNKRAARITMDSVCGTDGWSFNEPDSPESDPQNDTSYNANTWNIPPNPFDECNEASLSNSLFFADGIRSIDFVLVCEPDDNRTVEAFHADKRTTFEKNLLLEGLELENEVVDNIKFVKVHATHEVLRRYAEILKLRMPMKESLCNIEKSNFPRPANHATQFITAKVPGLAKSRAVSWFAQLQGCWGDLGKAIFVDEIHFPRKKEHRFTAIYSRDKEYLFDIQQTGFFTAAIRSRIVKFILDRKRFTASDGDDYAFGIERLIDERVYIAAYPLHDGDIKVPGSMRNLLYTEWSSVWKWYRYQPLDYIKDYFGVKIGLYFAWLGYYTYMLLLASIVGVLCFIYSWNTVHDYEPSKDICESLDTIKMCPLCDHWCDYWDLKETCVHAKTTYLFDNPTTVFFAVFMSFWATLFLELWKRYSAEITHRWDLTGFDIHEEHPRPQYLARLAHVKKMKIDYVTNTKEPQPPFWRMKLPATLFSFSVVILLVAMAVATVLGVVLYRMSVMAALTVHTGKMTTSSAIIFTTATAACINLCLIVMLNWVYTFLAEYLTELELLRTQTEFDDSLTLKIYLLQFVNYYASIFYIAFLKGKFVGRPGEYNRFINYRQEECGLGGCLMELCIQLAIIMIGKQAVNTLLEMLLPKFFKWYNTAKVKIFKRNGSLKGKNLRWLKDLKLVEWGPRSLFPEYLEMVLQYGFVTIFVAAFPLAPLFALLNNILEMRLDAKKLLTFHKRPVTQRVKGIGVWYRILDSIGKLSVITNGFIIAFTSDFIPRLYYRFGISEDGSLRGYLEFSLAYFNTTNFEKASVPRVTEYNGTICRYPDFREAEFPYERTKTYWLIMASKLGFVVLFENIVALVMIIVRWCIPDMSAELKDQIRREAYITNEIIIHQEALRAQTKRKYNPRLSVEQKHLNRMESLMDPTLTADDLDLVMHLEHGASGKRKQGDASQSLIDVEKGNALSSV